jgi:hypothetical protein
VKQRLLLGAAALVAGVALGWASGWYFGTSAGRDAILKEWIYSDARDVQAQVVVLRRLREKKTGEAIELLETRLDDQLVQFDPQPPFSMLTDRERDGLRKAIAEAKDYRTAFPRQSNRKFVDEMVRSVFSRDLYK